MNIIKPFYMNDNSILINLTTSLCKSKLEILNSKGFKLVYKHFYDSIDKSSNRQLFKIKTELDNAYDIIELYKLLLIYTFHESVLVKDSLNKLLNFQTELLFFTERLFDFWRNYERYGIIQRKLTANVTNNHTLIEYTDIFLDNVISLYRIITSKLNNGPINVYRQTPAGFNAGFIVSPSLNDLPKGYEVLNNIDIINAIMMRTPFIGHSFSNSRKGVFQQIDHNPITNLNLTKRHWICYPIKVGVTYALIYFHRTLLHHGIGLSNLFEPAMDEYCKGRKPDLIYVYGNYETEDDKTFYIDEENDIYVGYVSRLDENDYFGYMKKMILTLHNVYMIKHNRLPIHGAMVNIVLDNNEEKNIVIIGDSGAGKSETLEALRFVADAKIKEMNIVFDDMGVFYVRDKTVYAIGTEIGAFIRLDDLETGYAYKELDRAIFLNPERLNARVILPVSSHDFIVKEHKIDYVFSANNYEDADESIRYFSNIEEAVPVFIEGKRKAKGTTAEVGLVSSYFSNPFGCVQFEKETETIIHDVFKKLFKSKVVIGELYTKLGIPGKETSGVKKAAKAIKELL
ncbi:MAG: phosphoenolpyruvate carboxykinase [Tenericutes bacterium]|nr:phosphoenolpyruvate carboxykinase [Mycoplasmatota bacterium]